MADFSCIPCAGSRCFRLPVAERTTCSQERHPCPFQVGEYSNHEWLCRCCPACERACLKETRL